MDAVITIKIKNFESFYNPFCGDFAKNKSLNPDLEAYLEECLKAYTLEDIEKVRFHLQIENCNEDQKKILEKDLKKYFKKKYEDHIKNMDHLNKVRKRELFYGVFIILVCMFINNLLDRIIKDYQFTDPINTIIIVIGWVGIWVPAVYFLYTKKDLERKANFLKVVTTLPVEYKKIKIKS